MACGYYRRFPLTALIEFLYIESFSSIFRLLPGRSCHYATLDVEPPTPFPLFPYPPFVKWKPVITLFPELATLLQGRSLLNPVVSCFVGHLRHHIAIKSAQQVATRTTFELAKCSKMPMRCVTCKDSSSPIGAEISARRDRKQLSRHYHSKAAKISKLIFGFYSLFFSPF